MKKDIKDYLHYYIGALCVNLLTQEPETIRKVNPNNSGIFEIKAEELPELINHFSYNRLILRSIADMTHQEAAEACFTGFYTVRPENYAHLLQNRLTPGQFHYLLKNHFDVFGLIGEGLAIDRNMLKYTLLDDVPA